MYHTMHVGKWWRSPHDLRRFSNQPVRKSSSAASDVVSHLISVPYSDRRSHKSNFHSLKLLILLKLMLG
jgi:hypothetical protein